MNSISSYGVMNSTKNCNYFKQNCDKKFSYYNVSFSAKPISNGLEKKRFSFSTIMSKLGINKNKQNKQLVKQIENLLKDKSYVKSEHSSFFNPEVNKFIFGNDNFMKEGILPNIGCVYKADNHYIIQTWQDNIATFKKLDKKGRLIDTINVFRKSLL